MKIICAVVKPFKVVEITDAFRGDRGFPGMTVLEGGGFGRERGRPHRHSATEDLADFTHHSILLVAVPDGQVEAIVGRIAQIAHTGQPGDGKVFVIPLESAVAITTGETGDLALV